MQSDGPTSASRQEGAQPYSAVTTSGRSLDPAFEIAAVQMCAQIYATESAAHWGRYNAQLLANAGLLGAMTLGSQNTFVHAHLHVITILGGETSAIWLLLSLLSARRLSATAEAMGTALDGPFGARVAGMASALSHRSALNRISWTLPTLAVLAWMLLFLSKSGL